MLYQSLYEIGQLAQVKHEDLLRLARKRRLLHTVRYGKVCQTAGQHRHREVPEVARGCARV